MSNEPRIEVLSEVEGIGPVEVLEIIPVLKVTNYRTVMPIVTLSEAGSEVRIQGFTFCMN